MGMAGLIFEPHPPNTVHIVWIEQHLPITIQSIFTQTNQQKIKCTKSKKEYVA